MTNTLIDNSNERLMLVKAIKECINNTSCNTIKIATGYWDIPGTALIYQDLKDFLAKEGVTFQLLIGADPYVRQNQLAHPLHKDAKFPQDYIKRDIQELDVKKEYVDVVRMLQEYCHEEETDSKLQIRIYKKDKDGDAQFFHAKCYIFCGQNYAVGIIGSSNFTQKGLEGNSELNYLETDTARVTAFPNEYSYTKGHISWFDEKWNLSMPWNKTFLEEIIKGAPVTVKAEEKKAEEDNKLTPYELYIKLLQYKFGDIVDLNQQQLIESYLPPRFDPLTYQIQAVKQCFSIMKEHGGFMLADVVGLGKTIVGALVIKHFLTLPEDDGRERKVLIVTPPAIQSGWKQTIKQFDDESTDKMESAIDYITTGSISKLVDDIDFDENDETTDLDSDEFTSDIEYKNYGLIIIDESHKFRNSSTSMYHSLDDLIAQIGSTTGAYPYIGLLSATPQNNRPSDLQNQIYLFERNHADSTLKKANGGNLEGFFADINRRYGHVIKSPKSTNDSGTPNEKLTPEQRKSELKKLSGEIRDCVLQDILVRRTRTDVQEFYKDDIKKQGIVFPHISGPHPLEYKMESGLATLFADTMNLIAPTDDFRFDNSDFLCYYRYRAIEFLKSPEVKRLYKGRNIDPDRFSQQLAKIMQINLVKRIESSFSAFKSSLRNLRRYTQNMIDMWERNTIFICPDIDVNKELNREKNFEATHKLCSFEDCANDIRAKIEKLNQNGKNEKGRNQELSKEAFSQDYIELLRKDLELIDFLCNRWNAYSNDPKLEKFKKELRNTLFDKERNPSQKLVIFSEAIDTVNAIKLAIETTDENMKVLVVTAKNRDKSEQLIAENFDANYTDEWKNDYQVIVTTEVLAEGVNLHRANCILNYDTPWNSTRLMQRIGRVNRIGSTAPYIYVYNFMPSAQGDAQIRLVQKAYTKLQSFHTLFGEDNQVFTEDEEVMHYDLNKQVNGEESPMEKYVFELKEYKNTHPERFAQIAEKEDGLELAISPTDNCSYFLVRNTQISGLFVKVDADLNSSMLSGIDMYKSFRTDEDIPAAPLPENWEQRKAKAELAANQALSRMNIHAKNSQKATKAKEIILRMKDNITMSKESRSLLASAFNLVNKGNFDIIKKIIALDELKKQNGNTLFDFTQEEFDAVIKREIENIVANVQQRYGKAQTYIAISK
jgi:superfamily II DNA or RNA helicase